MHSHAASSHSGPKKLLKELLWREQQSGEDDFPTMTLTELHEHIQANRVRFSPPVQFPGFNTQVIETLRPDFPTDLVHFCIALKHTVPLKEGKRITYLPSSRPSSPQNK